MSGVDSTQKSTPSRLGVTPTFSTHSTHSDSLLNTNLNHRVEISVAFHYYFFLLNQPNYRLPFIAKASSGCFEIEQGLVSGLIKQQDHFVLKAVLPTLSIWKSIFLQKMPRMPRRMQILKAFTSNFLSWQHWLKVTKKAVDSTEKIIKTTKGNLVD